MVQMSPMKNNGEISRNWKQFLRKKVDNFIKWDLVRFFHDNPYTVDTAEHIASFIGRDVDEVATELEDMARVGLLEVQVRGEHTLYRLTQQPTIRSQVNDFVMACHNREFRARAIQHLMQVTATAS